VTQGTFGVIQGTFAVTQGTFGVIQGTFGVIQGTFGVIQGRFGVVSDALLCVDGRLALLIQHQCRPVPVDPQSNIITLQYYHLIILQSLLGLDSLRSSHAVKVPIATAGQVGNYLL
jgi:hypothetical protein